MLESSLDSEGRILDALKWSNKKVVILKYKRLKEFRGWKVIFLETLCLRCFLSSNGQCGRPSSLEFILWTSEYETVSFLFIARRIVRPSKCSFLFPGHGFIVWNFILREWFYAVYILMLDVHGVIRTVDQTKFGRTCRAMSSFAASKSLCSSVKNKIAHCVYVWHAIAQNNRNLAQILCANRSNID